VGTTLQSTSLVAALLRSLRPHQWAKNTLIFIPLILAGRAGDPQAWISCSLGFLAWGLVASAAYLVNDLKDLAFDRHHPSKRHRPLANGELTVRIAVIASVAIGACGLVLAAFLGKAPFLILLVYAIASIAYSFGLKRLPILDILILAALFTMRLIFGIAVAEVPASPWLLVFSMFVFMSLSLAKRYTEAARNGDDGRHEIEGRGYISRDTPLLLALGVATTAGAVLIMILYLIEEAFAAAFYRRPEILWFLPVILFLWLGRIWLLAGRQVLDEDPIRFAIGDRACLALGLAMVLVFIVAWRL
jgi:4-hydroxybenzoate polyprenyltransferase